MNRLVVYFVVALFILGVGWLLYRSVFPGVATQEQTTEIPGTKGWVLYNSPSQLWSASFPKEPKFSTAIFRDDLGLPEISLEGADAESEGDVYYVRVYHYHMVPPKTLKDFLDQALAGWRKKFPAVAISSAEKGQFKGNDSLNFTLLGKNLEIEGMVIKSTTDYYIIGLIGKSTDQKKNEEHYQNFLNSFNFVTP